MTLYFRPLYPCEYWIHCDSNYNCVLFVPVSSPILKLSNFEKVLALTSRVRLSICTPTPKFVIAVCYHEVIILYIGAFTDICDILEWKINVKV